MKTIHYIDTPEGVVAVWELNYLHIVKYLLEQLPDLTRDDFIGSAIKLIIENGSDYQTGDPVTRVCPDCEAGNVDDFYDIVCFTCNNAREIKYTLEKVELKQAIDIFKPHTWPENWYPRYRKNCPDLKTYLCTSLATRIK
jgi:hypothetical protein